MAAVVAGCLEWMVTREGAWLVNAVVGLYALAAVVAVRSSPEMAASAVRFSSILLIVVGSVPVWLRHRLGRVEGMLGGQVGLLRGTLVRWGRRW